MARSTRIDSMAALDKIGDLVVSNIE